MCYTHITFETLRKVYEAFAREVRKYDSWLRGF